MSMDVVPPTIHRQSTAEDNGFNTDDEWESGDSCSKLYERSRIKALADERESVQKKTFCKWINSHLAKYNCKIEDFYLDLRDGKVLLKLLEILSGEKLPRPTRGKMRIHCLENVDKSLNFLYEQRVHMENMGAHDIVDGSPRLTLGLIWTIILRFQIQDITIQEYDHSETKQAKDALLLWCQMKTAGYSNVNIRNFTSSWRDGLAFNAIIHKHRPDLIDYTTLSKANPVQNLEQAFTLAEEQFGLTRLLDPEDIMVESPDERSLITYVVTFYHYFSKVKADTVHSKRVGKVLNQAIESSTMIHHHDQLTSDLLDWIEQTIHLLNDRTFSNSLSGVQQQLAAFNTYRTVEKPPKFTEKGNLEILLFTIQSNMRANNQKPFMPGDGRLVADINSAWEKLEKAEHARELAVRDELIRQEKLEQLAARFDRKAGMREAWLAENQRLVAQDNFGEDLAAVEAATKKHEAIETDIFAYEERVNAVMTVAAELEREQYHGLDRIRGRQENVLALWDSLLALLKTRRARLEISLQLHHIFQEMIYLMDWIEEIRARLLSEDYGKHLMGVEDLLQKHGLLESDIKMLADRMNQILNQAYNFIDRDLPSEVGDYTPVDPEIIKQRGEELQKAYESLQQLAADRRKRLDDSRLMWQFLWDLSDKEHWIKEKTQLMLSPDLGHDMSSVHRLLNKHRALEEEMRNKEVMMDEVVQSGKELIRAGNSGAPKIRERTLELQEMWNEMKKLAEVRQEKLQRSLEYFQFLSDCEDVEVWMVEQLRIVSSDNTGNTEALVKAMLRQHDKIRQEVVNYGANIDELHALSEKFPKDNVNSDSVSQKLEVIDKRYQELLDKTQQREVALQDALSMYRVFNETDAVRVWITEKEKLLTTLVPGDEIEELEVVRHRFTGFEQEMMNNADKVAIVNSLAQRLTTVDHPQSERIVAQQDELNVTWNTLADLVEQRRSQISESYQYNQFLLECKQTKEWITEKERLIESTDELGDDLAGIMQLQRKIGGLQRDMDAIKTKVNNLDSSADQLIDKRPEEAELLSKEREELDQKWIELQEMLKERHDRLTESSELQAFLQDLDHIHMWLSRMQTTVASEDIPKDLADAEKALSSHEQLKEEIDSYKAEFDRLLEYGRRVTQGQTDAQYMFLSQRLNALDDGWKELRQMWEQTQVLLSQSLSLQIFLRDVLQAEILLSQQDNYLSKEEPATTLEVAQKQLRDHENFLGIMTANDERVNAVIDFGNKLLEREHYAEEKIKQKVDSMSSRRQLNRTRSMERLNNLQNTVLIKEVSQDVEDMEEWIQEKIMVASEIGIHGDKDITSQYNKHKAFEEEVEANKERLEHVMKEGNELVHQRPELAQYVQPKLNELQKQWDDLDTASKQKGEKMIEANRAVIFDKGTSNVLTWLETIGEQIVVTEEEFETLTDVNVKMKKVDETDKELEVKKKQIQDLKAHADRLKQEQPDRAEEIEEKHAIIEQKFTQLLSPLTEKKGQLTQKKRIHQFFRDVEDEKIWIEEKMPLAESDQVGNSLLNAQQLLRRHKQLEKEVENHSHRINAVTQEGQSLLSEGHPQSSQIDSKIADLNDENWRRLTSTMEKRRKLLEANERAQSYLLDASEAEAWMGEQELFLMSEERARDDQGAINAIKKHEQRERAIEHYGEEIKKLGDRCNELLSSEHPDNDVIALKQARVDKLYAGLRDLCNEKRARLEELQQLNHLYKEIWDLELWIQERMSIASSHDVGVDLEHCCLLRERFRDFSLETETLGSDKVEKANQLCDSLIDCGHTDSAEVAQWKDRVNEAWADLLEYMDTRSQLLKAAWDLHKYFSDCQDVLERIAEKMTCIPSDVSKDSKSVATQQRKHAAFEHDINTLAAQVQVIVDTATNLLPLYSSHKELMICDKRDEVLREWNNLQVTAEKRKFNLSDANDLQRFLSMIRELIAWVDCMSREMIDKEKPRDVSGVELLMNSHRSLKAEMDAREENMSICLNLGRTLLHRGHVASEEVRENLIRLVTERFYLDEKWNTRWEDLQLILEVYQFARDASVAEQWLVGHSTYLTNQDLGSSLDETLTLLKKHLAFEKAAATQEERFQALAKLTTFEVRARERTADTIERMELQKQARLNRLLEEFRKPKTPPPSTAKTAGHPAKDVAKRSSFGSSPPSKETVESAASGPSSPPSGEPGTSVPSAPMEFERKEGHLSRKHEWDSHTKKASNRSWHELVVVLDPKKGGLLVYKDARHASRDRGGETYRKEAMIPLSPAGNISTSPATDYTKRQNVFRLKVNDTGAEYLFMARNSKEMHEWIEAINRTQAGGGSHASPSGPGQKASTLPSQPTKEEDSGQAPSSSKKRFFTLGRKK